MVRVLLILVAVLATGTCASAQSLLPDNYLSYTEPRPAPREGRDVWVSAALVRLLSVSDTDFTFKSITSISLSWSDARASKAMRASTATYRENVTNKSAEAKCSTPCSSQGVLPSPSTFLCCSDYLCCDGVWLPALQG